MDNLLDPMDERETKSEWGYVIFCCNNNNSNNNDNKSEFADSVAMTRSAATPFNERRV